MNSTAYISCKSNGGGLGGRVGEERDVWRDGKRGQRPSGLGGAKPGGRRLQAEVLGVKRLEARPGRKETAGRAGEEGDCRPGRGGKRLQTGPGKKKTADRTGE